MDPQAKAELLNRIRLHNFHKRMEKAEEAEAEEITETVDMDDRLAKEEDDGELG